MVGINELLEKTEYGFDDLISIVSILRDKDIGCPWDIKQTHQSIRNNFIEETYEVVEAINENDKDHLLEELGDVLLKVVLNSSISAMDNVFTIEDVCNGICRKLINRHPHVFGRILMNQDGIALRSWDDIKKVEKSQKTVVDTLTSISRTLPSLMRASKLQRKANSEGLINDFDILDICESIQHAVDNVRMGGQVHTIQEIGSLLMDVVKLSVVCNVEAEEALYQACEAFIYDMGQKI